MSKGGVPHVKPSTKDGVATLVEFGALNGFCKQVLSADRGGVGGASSDIACNFKYRFML